MDPDDDRPTIAELAHRVAQLRAELADAPESAAAHVELVHALTQLADTAPDLEDRAGQADEPIALLRTAAGLAGEDRPDVLIQLTGLLAWQILTRYELEGSGVSDRLAADRDEAISCLEQVWQFAVETDQLAEFVADEVPTVQRVVDLLLVRARETGAADDLATAISYAEAVLDVHPVRNVDRAITHYQLANAHCLRDNGVINAGPPDARRPAIPHLRALLDMPAGEHPWHDEATVQLGIQLAQRILGDPGNTGEVNEAIDQLLGADKLLAADDPGTVELRTLVRFQLGMMRALRYAAMGGDDSDHASAVAELNAVIDAEETQPAMADLCRTVLANLQLIRSLPAEFRAGPQTINNDLVKQLTAKKQEPYLTEADADEVTRQLNGLSESARTKPALAAMSRWLQAIAILGKGISGQSPEELDRALTLLDEEIGHGALPDEDIRLLLIIMRGVLGNHQARARGDMVAADQALDLLIKTAEHIKADHPMRRLLEDALGGTANARGAEPISTEEFVEAALRLEKVLDELPDDHPNRAGTLAKLVITLLNTVPFGKQPMSLARLRARLLDTIDRPAADDSNAGMNHVLLGWVEGLQGTLEENPELIRLSLDRYRKAATLLPPDHPLFSTLTAALSATLLQRYAVDGTLENVDAAAYYGQRAMRPMPHPSAPAPTERQAAEHKMHSALQVTNALVTVVRNRERLDAGQVDELIEMVEAAAPASSDGSNLVADLRGSLDDLRMVRAAFGPDGVDFPTTGPRLAEFLAAADAVSAGLRAVPKDRVDYLDSVARAANASIGAGFAARNLRRLDQGIAMLAPLCVKPTAQTRQRLRFLCVLADGLRMRHELSHDGRDLDNAIDRLEEARRLAEQHPGIDAGITDNASIHFELGQYYFTRGDQNRRDWQRAVASGLAALWERAEDVLLQTGATRALDKANSATDEAAVVTSWCVATGEHESAVLALELGRGMVLHAATVEASVPALLRDGGHPELAAEWERESAHADEAAPWDLVQSTGERDDLTSTPIPSDLRRQVLAAIRDTETRVRMFSPPSVPDIASALRAADVEALVYLLPGDQRAAGLAILVDPAGAVRSWPLPRLRVVRGGPIEIFLQAQREMLTAQAEQADSAGERWSAALRQLCDWGWPAAMGPLLEQLIGVRPGRGVRLVLVPVGKLGAVPWHAARRPVPGGVRHAGQDAILSYAASARQFVDAANRQHQSWHTEPALVRVRDSRLYWDAKEMAQVRAHCYPECAYLGTDDDDTADGPQPVLPADIAALLPGPDGAGASVLHLSCHGSYAPVPVDSSLLLDNGTRLYVRDILRHARNRPTDAPGGLVVLATCVSDLTDNAHDEALTLASAFLAAGGVGVVGARWPVQDLPTALFMIMFHHYLNFGYQSPAVALRTAQLWMLNPNRRLPSGISTSLAGPMRRADLTAVENWAAFTYQGQ